MLIQSKDGTKLYFSAVVQRVKWTAIYLVVLVLVLAVAEMIFKMNSVLSNVLATLIVVVAGWGFYNYRFTFDVQGKVLYWPSMMFPVKCDLTEVIQEICINSKQTSGKEVCFRNNTFEFSTQAGAESFVAEVRGLKLD